MRQRCIGKPTQVPSRALSLRHRAQAGEMAVVWPIPLEKGWAHRLQGRNSSWLSMVQPTWALKLVPRGSQRPPASPHSRTDLCGTQLSLGKPVCPPPLPTPLQGISSHLPPIAANTVIQRVISKETKKKKDSRRQGKFQPQSKWFQRSLDSTQDAARGSQHCQHRSQRTGHKQDICAEAWGRR